MRKRYLPLAAVLGFAAAVLPAVSGSASEPTFQAVGSAYGYFSWQPATAEVGAGGAVTFQNMSSSVEHGVVWSGGPETPSCTGVPINKGETSWKGSCTFAKAGTYTFYCPVHGREMSGTITVTAAGTTTGTTTSTTPTGTSTPGTTPTSTSTTPGGHGPGGGPLGVLMLRHAERGSTVTGSLEVSSAGAGARLEVDVFAKSASLARRTGRVLIGRLVRGSVSPGRASFTVRLNARARNALRRHGRLALTVAITLTPRQGAPLSIVRTVVVHA